MSAALDAVLRQAHDEIERGQLDAARKRLNASLANGDARLHLLLSRTFQRDGLLDNEIATLAAALRSWPEDVELHLALARARWAAGEGDRFADPMLAAIKAQPRHLALRLRGAELLGKAGQGEAAETLLREAARQAPNDPAIDAWLGVLLDERGQLDEALERNARVAAAFPNQPTLQLNLAHVLMRLGRGQEALAPIATARKVQPLNQIAIAYEWTALRQTNSPRARWLLDFERDVQAFDLAPPPGLASVAAFNSELAQRLRGLQKLAAHPLDQTLRLGSQTSQDLLVVEDPVVKAYLAALDAPIRAYIAAMGDDPSHPLLSRRTGAQRISGAWSVLLRANGFHVNHTHDAWISSSYYVSLPESMGDASSHEGWIKFGEPRWPMPGVGVERMVEPKEGRLVLFPSYCWHGTVPFKSGERLTAPFDVMPVAS